MFFNSVDMSVSDCLLYGQYGLGIRINNPPSRTLISNVDIQHTYHYHMAVGRRTLSGMFTWAIDIEPIVGNGGKHLITGCVIDQSPTWQEYYFAANPSHRRYYVDWFPGSHAVFAYNLSRRAPATSSASSTRRSQTAVATASFTICPTPTSVSRIAWSTAAISATHRHRIPLFDDWRGNCVLVGRALTRPVKRSPGRGNPRNELIARGLNAWGARLFGYGNGEVTIADNTITCASASDVGLCGRN